MHKHRSTKLFCRALVLLSLGVAPGYALAQTTLTGNHAVTGTLDLEDQLAVEDKDPLSVPSFLFGAYEDPLSPGTLIGGFDMIYDGAGNIDYILRDTSSTWTWWTSEPDGTDAKEFMELNSTGSLIIYGRDGSGDPVESIELIPKAGSTVGKITIDGALVLTEKVGGKVEWGNGMTVGNYSTAWGDATASAHFSTAWGSASSMADYSTTWGGAYASGEYSTAWGLGEAYGATSTAWGGAIAEASYSTAWGSGTYAEGLYSTSWGVLANSVGEAATAWGHTTAADGDQSTAWGSQSVAGGEGSTAWGDASLASGDFATAWGNGSTAHGVYATAWGLALLSVTIPRHGAIKHQLRVNTRLPGVMH